LLLSSLATALSTQGATYDLNADWSDSSNPNGVWTYREGTNALPHVTAWQGLSGDFVTRPTGLGTQRHRLVEFAAVV